MYYCIAVAYVPAKLGILLPHNTSSNLVNNIEYSSRSSLLMPITLALLFLMGAAVPIAERLVPTNDFENITSTAKETFVQTKTLSSAQINSFLQQDNAVLLSGLALYPRYYTPDSRIYMADLPINFAYLNFTLINNGAQPIVLPLQNNPVDIPHTATVSVLGCKANGYISAWAVVIHSQSPQVLSRVPNVPLACPLAEPK